MLSHDSRSRSPSCEVCETSGFRAPAAEAMENGNEPVHVTSTLSFTLTLKYETCLP